MTEDEFNELKKASEELKEENNLRRSWGRWEKTHRVIIDVVFAIEIVLLAIIAWKL